jgi:cephalosporin hydroxylase
MERKTPEQIQGWHGEATIFGELIKEVKPSDILEIGSWKGQSTVNMAIHAPEARIMCVDTWLGSSEMYLKPLLSRDMHRDEHGYPHIFEIFMENIRGYDNIEILPLDSQNASEVLLARDYEAQLIYLDAGHSEPSVRADIERYLPMLAERGIIFGDDYNRVFPGLKAAVDDLLPGRTIVEPFWIYRS